MTWSWNVGAQGCHSVRPNSVDAGQLQGLGRDLFHSLLAHHPGYRWSTTLQTRQGWAFFVAMARETTVALPQGGPLCSDLMGWFRRTRQRLLDRWPSR